MRLMNVGETQMFYCVELGMFITIRRFEQNSYSVVKYRLGDVNEPSLRFCHAFAISNKAKRSLKGVIKAAIDHCVLPMVVKDKRGYEVIPIEDWASNEGKHPWPLGMPKA